MKNILSNRGIRDILSQSNLDPYTDRLVKNKAALDVISKSLEENINEKNFSEYKRLIKAVEDETKEEKEKRIAAGKKREAAEKRKEKRRLEIEREAAKQNRRKQELEDEIRDLEEEIESAQTITTRTGRKKRIEIDDEELQIKNELLAELKEELEAVKDAKIDADEKLSETDFARERNIRAEKRRKRKERAAKTKKEAEERRERDREKKLADVAAKEKLEAEQSDKKRTWKEWNQVKEKLQTLSEKDTNVALIKTYEGIIDNLSFRGSREKSSEAFLAALFKIADGESVISKQLGAINKKRERTEEEKKNKIQELENKYEITYDADTEKWSANNEDNYTNTLLARRELYNWNHGRYATLQEKTKEEGIQENEVEVSELENAIKEIISRKVKWESLDEEKEMQAAQKIKQRLENKKKELDNSVKNLKAIKYEKEIDSTIYQRPSQKEIKEWEQKEKKKIQELENKYKDNNGNDGKYKEPKKGLIVWEIAEAQKEWDEWQQQSPKTSKVKIKNPDTKQQFEKRKKKLLREAEEATSLMSEKIREIEERIISIPQKGEGFDIVIMNAEYDDISTLPRIHEHLFKALPSFYLKKETVEQLYDYTAVDEKGEKHITEKAKEIKRLETELSRLKRAVSKTIKRGTMGKLAEDAAKERQNKLEELERKYDATHTETDEGVEWSGKDSEKAQEEWDKWFGIMASTKTTFETSQEPKLVAPEFGEYSSEKIQDRISKLYEKKKEIDEEAEERISEHEEGLKEMAKVAKENAKTIDEDIQDIEDDIVEYKKQKKAIDKAKEKGETIEATLRAGSKKEREITSLIENITEELKEMSSAVLEANNLRTVLVGDEEMSLEALSREIKNLRDKAKEGDVSTQAKNKAARLKETFDEFYAKVKEFENKYKTTPFKYLSRHKILMDKYRNKEAKKINLKIEELLKDAEKEKERLEALNKQIQVHLKYSLKKNREPILKEVKNRVEGKRNDAQKQLDMKIKRYQTVQELVEEVENNEVDIIRANTKLRGTPEGQYIAQYLNELNRLSKKTSKMIDSDLSIPFFKEKYGWRELGLQKDVDELYGFIGNYLETVDNQFPDLIKDENDKFIQTGLFTRNMNYLKRIIHTVKKQNKKAKEIYTGRKYLEKD